jgi:hypothetical protein
VLFVLARIRTSKKAIIGSTDGTGCKKEKQQNQYGARKESDGNSSQKLQSHESVGGTKGDYHGSCKDADICRKKIFATDGGIAVKT